MVMKKSFYLLAVLMLGISCALWTGCSDDDEPGTELPPAGGENPGDTITPGDTIVPPVMLDTTWIVKSVRMDDVNNEGFYTMIELTVAGKQVSGVKTTKYTPRGINGQPEEATIDYGTSGKVAVSYTEGGMDMAIEYTLNAKGLISGAIVNDMSEPEDPYQMEEYKFSYNSANGMLESIVMVDGEDEYDVFKATFSADSNWATCLADAENGVSAACAVSEVDNNYTVDLNMLSLNYGISKAIDYAILSGLVPVTPNLLKSVTAQAEDSGEEMVRPRAGEMVMSFVPTVVADRISVLDVKVGNELLKKYTFGY